MITEHFYVFGYETPEDHAVNASGEGEQESFGFFRIMAQSEDEALSWGRELSCWYTNQLFRNDGEAHWHPTWFASWIEPAPDEKLREAARLISICNVGEYPDMEQVRALFAD